MANGCFRVKICFVIFLDCKPHHEHHHTALPHWRRYAYFVSSLLSFKSNTFHYLKPMRPLLFSPFFNTRKHLTWSHSSCMAISLHTPPLLLHKTYTHIPISFKMGLKCVKIFALFYIFWDHCIVIFTPEWINRVKLLVDRRPYSLQHERSECIATE